MTVSRIVARAIRDARRRKGWTLAAMAKQVGWPVSTYAGLEYGECRICVDRLFAVLEILHIDIDDVWPQASQGVDLSEVMTALQASRGALVHIRNGIPKIITQKGFGAKGTRKLFDQAYDCLRKQHGYVIGERSGAGGNLYLILDMWPKTPTQKERALARKCLTSYLPVVKTSGD